MIGFLFLLLAPDLTANVIVDRSTIRLSDHAIITVSVEGPAPLAVEIPADWLAEESSANWRAKAIAPAKIETLTNGRERWSISLRVDPYATGDPITITLKSLDVRSGQNAGPQHVDLPSVTVRVTTDVSTIRPEEARSITGIESVPESAGSSQLWWWAVGILLSFVIAAIWIIHKRWTAHELPETNEHWLERRMAALERETDSRAVANGVSELLRDLVTRKCGVPLESRTANEAVFDVRQSTAITQAIDCDEFESLLKECERIQFDPISNGSTKTLLARAKNWLAQTAR